MSACRLLSRKRHGYLSVSNHGRVAIPAIEHRNGERHDLSVREAGLYILHVGRVYGNGTGGPVLPGCSNRFLRRRPLPIRAGPARFVRFLRIRVVRPIPFFRFSGFLKPFEPNAQVSSSVRCGFRRNTVVSLAPPVNVLFRQVHLIGLGPGLYLKVLPNRSGGKGNTRTPVPLVSDRGHLLSIIHRRREAHGMLHRYVWRKTCRSHELGHRRGQSAGGERPFHFLVSHPVERRNLWHEPGKLFQEFLLTVWRHSQQIEEKIPGFLHLRKGRYLLSRFYAQSLQGGDLLLAKPLQFGQRHPARDQSLNLLHSFSHLADPPLLQVTPQEAYFQALPAPRASRVPASEGHLCIPPRCRPTSNR